MSEGFARLVQGWILTVEVDGKERAQMFRPLIDELTHMVHPSKNSRGGGGMTSTRNVLNVNALDLLTHIQDVTRAWLDEWNMHVSKDDKADIARFRSHAETLHATGVIETTLYERLTSYPDTWAARIWDLMEPPLQRPLRDAECPRCGVKKITNAAGEVSDALVLERRYGQEVTAVCRADSCTATWVGEDGLKALGRELGIEFNIEALASNTQ